MPKILSAQNGEKRQTLVTLIGLSVFGNFRDTRGFYWLLQLLVEFIGGQMAVALRGIQQYKATTSPWAVVGLETSLKPYISLGLAPSRNVRLE